MTVRQLIEELQKQNPDLPVAFDDPENGPQVVSGLRETVIYARDERHLDFLDHEHVYFKLPVTVVEITSL